MGASVLSLGVAVVISADLIQVGDQFGCLPRSKAAMPAMCGLDIDVPDRAL